MELFAGSHSVSRAVRRCFGRLFDVRVLSVDLDPKSRPGVLADINSWKYKGDIDAFLKGRKRSDIVAAWASPPCTAFSIANSTGVRDIKGGSRNVKSGLRVMRYTRPHFWMVENPQGLLKEQPFMRKMKRYINTCSYCRYGTKYRKSSNIWSDVPDLHLKVCKGETQCEEKRRYGIHRVSAQKGPSGGIAVGSVSGRNVYGIPPRLVCHLFRRGLAHAVAKKRQRP